MGSAGAESTFGVKGTGATFDAPLEFSGAEGGRTVDLTGKAEEDTAIE